MSDNLIVFCFLLAALVLAVLSPETYYIGFNIIVSIIEALTEIF